MPRPADRDQTPGAERGGGWRKWWRGRPAMSDEYSGFLLLNTFDLFLTGYIFRHGGREVNPVGVAVMERFGLGGFALFKYSLVAVVVLAVEVLYRLKPSVARRVMNGGNLVYFGVIVWECVLLLFHR